MTLPYFAVHKIELAPAAPSRSVPAGNALRLVCSGNIQSMLRPVITVLAGPKYVILVHGSASIGSVATNDPSVTQSKSRLKKCRIVSTERFRRVDSVMNCHSECEHEAPSVTECIAIYITVTNILKAVTQSKSLAARKDSPSIRVVLATCHLFDLPSVQRIESGSPR